LKVITFNGSARHDGNTAILIKHVFAELKKANIEIDWGKILRGCTACTPCYRLKNQQCSVMTDDLVGKVHRVWFIDFDLTHFIFHPLSGSRFR